MFKLSLCQNGEPVCGRIIATRPNREAETMATQREAEAADYLKKHRLMELLEHLSGLLFFHRPGSFPLSVVYSCS